MYGDDGSSGDSAPNLVTLVNADLTDPAFIPVGGATSTGARATFTGVASQLIPNTTFRRSINVVNGGVSGNHISDVLADMAGRIFAFNPDVIISLGWINDSDGVFFSWDAPTFTAQYQSFINQLIAWKPTIRYLETDAILSGESYTVSPPAMGPNSGLHDPDIDAQAVIMQTILAAAGPNFQFAPIRPLLVQWEIISNPLNEATGHFNKQGDGLHFAQLGARQLGAWIKARIQTMP